MSDAVQRAIQLQRLLFEGNSSDWPTVMAFLHENGYLTDRDQTYALIADVLRAVECRPWAIESLAQLSLLICNHKPTFGHLLLRELFRDVRKSRLSFALTGVRIGIFKVEAIFSLVELGIRDRWNEHALFNTVAWFAPDFHEFDSERYKNVLKNFQADERAFLEKVTEIETLRKPDFKRLRLVEAIRKDDVDTLKGLFDAKEFAIDGFMPSFLFEPFDFLCNDLSPLAYCAYFGAVRCFEFLLSNGASFESSSNVSVIEAAISGGSIAILNALGDKLFTQTALHFAVLTHSNVVYDWIAEHTSESDDLLSDCCQSNNIEIALKRVNVEPVTADDIVLAAKNGCVEILKLLIDKVKGTDILSQADSSGELALLAAAEHAQVSVLKVLCEAGVDVTGDEPGTTKGALSTVAALDCLEGATLLAQRSNKDEKRNAFVAAAQAKFAATAKAILESGDVEIQESDEMVSSLILSGALDVYKSKGVFREQDIFLAINAKSFEFFSFLFDEHPPKDIKAVLSALIREKLASFAKYVFSKREFTQQDAEEMILLCIKYDSLAILNLVCGLCTIDINKQDEDGYTPLMRSLAGRHLQISDALFSIFDDQIDVNVYGNDGKTALDIAIAQADDLSVYGIVTHPRFAPSQMSSEMGTRIFYLAALWNNLDLMKAIYAAVQNINPNLKEKGESPLSLAGKHKNQEMTNFLLQLPTIELDANALATSGASDDVLIHALETGRLDPNAKVGLLSLFTWAAKEKRSQLLKAIAKSPSFNPYGGFADPLSDAIRQNFVEAFDALLESPSINLNKMSYSSCPLMDATDQDNPYFFDVLMSRPDIDVNAKTSGNKGVILHAVEKGRLDRLEKLLARDDICVTGLQTQMQSPYSAAKGLLSRHPGDPVYEKIVKLLEEKGVTEEKQDSTGGFGSIQWKKDDKKPATAGEFGKGASGTSQPLSFLQNGNDWLSFTKKDDKKPATNNPLQTGTSGTNQPLSFLQNGNDWLSSTKKDDKNPATAGLFGNGALWTNQSLGFSSNGNGWLSSTKKDDKKP